MSKWHGIRLVTVLAAALFLSAWWCGDASADHSGGLSCYACHSSSATNVEQLVTKRLEKKIWAKVIASNTPVGAQFKTRDAEALRTTKVITLEENALMGGFGSAVLECFAERQLSVPVLRLGLPDRFVEQGSQSELRRRCALDVAGVAAQVKAFLGQ